MSADIANVGHVSVAKKETMPVRKERLRMIRREKKFIESKSRPQIYVPPSRARFGRIET
jgi:hypothetical protein